MKDPLINELSTDAFQLTDFFGANILPETFMLSKPLTLQFKVSLSPNI